MDLLKKRLVFSFNYYIIAFFGTKGSLVLLVFTEAVIDHFGYLNSNLFTFKIEVFR